MIFGSLVPGLLRLFNHFLMTDSDECTERRIENES